MFICCVCMSLHEQMFSISGRYGFTQSVLSKPNPLAPKNFFLGTTDSIILDFCMYHSIYFVVLSCWLIYHTEAVWLQEQQKKHLPLISYRVTGHFSDQNFTILLLVLDTT
jgi:hypothetical protein